MPDGILFRPLVISELWDLRRVLEMLYSDCKFHARNVQKEELKKEIFNLEFAIDYNELLRTILKTYLKKVVQRYSSIRVDSI